MIVLYRDGYWISPYVFSCFVALREKQVDFEVREIALQRGEQKDAAYVSASVTGRVPSLTHDGFTVAESSAIVEYVDETFPGVHLLPTDIQNRARARALMSWIRSDDTFVIREERPTHTMFYTGATSPLGDRARAAASKLAAITERVLERSPPGPETNLFGDWCMADADLAFMLQRLVINGDALPSRVRGYAEAQWARPSVVEFVSKARPSYVPY